MAEKKVVEKKSASTNAKKKTNAPVKKTTTSSLTKTTKSNTKKTTTSSKTKSETTKKTPSKTTTKKENPSVQNKKNAKENTTTKKEKNKKKNTPKKKEETSKAKNTASVKLKESTPKTKKKEVQSKKEPIKKIVSTKKMEGKVSSLERKEISANRKTVSTLLEKIKDRGKKIGFFLKKIGSTPLLKRKEKTLKEKKEPKNKNKKIVPKFGEKVKLTNSLLFTKIKSNLKKTGFFFKKAGNTTISKIKQVSSNVVSNIKKGINQAKDFFEKKKINFKNKGEKIQEKKQNTQPEKKEGFNKKIIYSHKNKRILIGISLSCLALAILLMIPYGISSYKSGASNKNLDVPKFMKLKEECCNYSATFSSPRSAWALKKDVEKIISGYELLNCEGKEYYYNAKENYTITEYGVKKGLFLNQVYFTYGVGNSCDIDTKFKKLELLDDDFSIEDAKKDGNYVMEGDKVYNKKAYDDFMENVNAKIPSTLRIVTTNAEGDVLITDLEYLSSGKYMVSYDGTREKNTKNPRSIVAYKFEHLKLNKNKLYAYNGNKLVIKKAKKYETFYLLTLPSS